MSNTKTKESDILAALEVCKAWNNAEIDDNQYMILLRLACAKCDAPTITTAEKEGLLKGNDINIADAMKSK